MTKHNFYVITGGPGGGKTSLLENLAAKGYSYVPETARQIIQHRRAKGLSPRPDPRTFAEAIFTQDWTNFQMHLHRTAPLFFDRSFLDSACMRFESDAAAYREIGHNLKHRYNNNVFIAPPWKEIYRQDAERDQSFEDAVAVYERLHKWYHAHGYNLIVLPNDTVERRADFVLSRVTRLES
jgi:predicted ATPase